MLKNLKISYKMGLGFSLVLLLTAALGGISIYQMANIETNVKQFESKVTPLTEASSKIKEAFLWACYEIRGYSRTGDQQYLDQAQTYLKDAKSWIKNLDATAAEHNLESVAKDAKTMNQLVENYSKQLLEIQNEFVNIRTYQVSMNESAASYLKNCNDYLGPQHRKMAAAAQKENNTKEVGERNQKIQIINNIIDSGNGLRIAAFKARVKQDSNQMREAAKQLDSVKQQVDTILAMTTKQSDKDFLNNAFSNAMSYKQAMLTMADAWDNLKGFNEQRRNISSELLAMTEKVAQDASTVSQEVATTTNTVVSQATTLLIFGMIITLVLGSVIAYIITNGITKPVMTIVERIQDIAQGDGDLTKRVEFTSKDEIGQLANWFNTFVEKVHDIVSQVSSATQDVASASAQIAASSEEMASGMDEQTTQVAQVATAIEEMSSSVVEVAQKATDANGKADGARTTAIEGGSVVQSTVQGIQQIANDSDVVNSVISELGDQSDKIGEIILVIDDIADQTNLLALNAAIEAARAGEHGRGFAVVADEVRKLADRTTQATDNINSLIDVMQNKTKSAVEQMEKSKETVESGVSQAQQAGEALSTIVSGAGDVAEMIQNIAAAAEQQSAASEEISSNITSITAVIQQSSQGANQSAAAATQLSAKSEELQQLVNKFKIAV
ncbi:methyl-accepting chemotaxis protein [Planctomycetota bacterium]|nr:methyl-accepting chemotaxis protein [Planctomycetota bacterium]